MFFQELVKKSSSVAPGYTVDSKITLSFLFNIFPKFLHKLITAIKSGEFFLFNGVARVIV
jgi:hypothetical protein